MNRRVYKSDDGFLTAWVEQESSVHLKAVTSDGDPVEMNAVEARALAKILLEFADAVDE